MDTSFVFEVRRPKNDYEELQVRDAILQLNAEREKFGGIILDGELTRLWIGSLITRAKHDGLCLGAFLPNSSCLIGALLAVHTVLPFDNPFRKIAGGYGTFVHQDFRNRGVAEELYRSAGRMLKDMGYDCYMGAVMRNNMAARAATNRAGFKEHETSVLMRLQ